MYAIIATYYMLAGGMSTRLTGDRVTMMSGSAAECGNRLGDIKDSMRVLPVNIEIEKVK